MTDQTPSDLDALCPAFNYQRLCDRLCIGSVCLRVKESGEIATMRLPMNSPAEQIDIHIYRDALRILYMEAPFSWSIESAFKMTTKAIDELIDTRRDAERYRRIRNVATQEGSLITPDAFDAASDAIPAPKWIPLYNRHSPEEITDRTCRECKTIFPSRSEYMQHLADTLHEQLT